MKKVFFLFRAPVLLFCLASTAFGYEAIPFENGGSIEGVVEYSGASVPKDPMVMLSSETKYCGESLPARKYLIKNKKIENVIVYISDIKSGKAIPSEPVTVTNLKCEFLPHIAVGFKGKKIIMRTDDPFLHTFDVHAFLNQKELYHFALHEKGSSVTKTLLKAGLLVLSDYAHPWEHAYVYIFEHPYAAITDEQGKFVINDIPPGTYVVESWHEALGTQRIADVKIESRKISTIKLQYAGEKNPE